MEKIQIALQFWHMYIDFPFSKAKGTEIDANMQNHNNKQEKIITFQCK